MTGVDVPERCALPMLTASRLSRMSRMIISP